MELEEIKDRICSILIDVLSNENNGFEKRKYYIVSRLLWAIKSYPQFKIPSTRIVYHT